MDIDDKGRLLLPKDHRESLGIKKRVLVINLGDHLRIIPLPENPVKILDGAFTTNRSFKELRRKAEERAVQDVKR